MGVVQPPTKITVVMETRHVVVKNSWRTRLAVLRTASANAIAPRRPEKQIRCWY